MNSTLMRTSSRAGSPTLTPLPSVLNSDERLRLRTRRHGSTRFCTRPSPPRRTQMTIAPEGRRMLRVEARNSQTPIEDKPAWIKAKAHIGPEYASLKSLVRKQDLHTVCEEAGCPNILDRKSTRLNSSHVAISYAV